MQSQLQRPEEQSTFILPNPDAPQPPTAPPKVFALYGGNGHEFIAPSVTNTLRAGHSSRSVVH